MSKTVKIIAIVLIFTLAVGASTYFVLKKLDKGSDNKELTIDQVLEMSYDIPEITTNLQSKEFIKVSFKIQTNSKEAKDELAKRDFQVKNIIIQQLSQATGEEFKAKDSILHLENEIKDRVNEVMQTGKVEKVYTVSKMIQ